MEETKIALFKGQKIRRTIYNNEWWFVIIDVVAALTDSVSSQFLRQKQSRLIKRQVVSKGNFVGKKIVRKIKYVN